MKNKKIALIALVIIALCALSVLVSACKPDVPDTPDEPQYFTVRFEGEGVSTAPQRVKKGETATEPQDPLREGYVFEYWFQTEGTPFDFSTAITSDTTLTAKWKVEQAKIDPSVIPGSGTQDDPYLIQCEAHLELLANAVKNGEGNFANAHYQLTADLDLTNRKVKIGTQENPFKGTFDGDNHTISNLTQSLTVRNATETQTVALFAWTETALFSNLSLANVNYFAETLVVDKTVVIGGLAGFAELTQFSNVSVQGTIQTNFLEGTTAYVGGLVGYAYNGVSAQGQGFIAFCENCYANVEMSV
ncbi:MAG: InlB B-repeat-containing protein, partial [Candidatus Fimimonas sp.]